MRRCPLQGLCFCVSHPYHVLCVPRYKPVGSEELVTLSTGNLEEAWSHSKDNCLTVWCDITEVSDSCWWQPPLLLAGTGAET